MSYSVNLIDIPVIFIDKVLNFHKKAVNYIEISVKLKEIEKLLLF